MFVFDAGYDPVKVQQGLEESKSPCQILVRLRAGRSFYGDPSLSEPPANIGRPRRHGPKMKCKDPSTWPEPSAEHTCEDSGYGAVRVRAWAGLHPKVASHEGRGSRGPLPIVVGTLVLVEVERLPRGEASRTAGFVAVVGWPRGERAGSELALACLREALRPGTHLPLPQADVRMDQPPVSSPRAGRSVDVAGGGGLHAAAPGESERGGHEAAVGEALRSGPADPDAGTPGGFDTFGSVGDAREAAETLREVARKAQRKTLGPGEALPGHQEECLSPRRRPERGFCDGDKAHRKTLRA
jgi:hypothetical protein